jgi:hypothetical protein
VSNESGSGGNACGKRVVFRSLKKSNYLLENSPGKCFALLATQVVTGMQYP